ncbi:MAG: hypothetical protein NC310_00395 [Roseburia sp.]|nr:hypothetical protein [Anaeroplasma bactoclasticum]MCM1195511.1 hypothetical protein [Roseburia sp.]
MRETVPTGYFKAEDVKLLGKESKEAKKVISEPVEKEVPTSPEKPRPIGLEDIRIIARKLADAGRQAEYREILKDCGYEKVNQIQEKDYLRIYTEMLTLVDGEPF